MRFGLSTLTHNVFSTADSYIAVAAAAERAGFDFLSVSDHLIVPGKLELHYPYVVGGAFRIAQHGHCFDMLSTIAFLAGITKRIRLLTSVLVVPYRPAMLTAKMLATIDVLAKARLIVGVGAGWMKEEFDLLDANFTDRGRVTDEYVAAFIELWTKERSSYRGHACEFFRRDLRAEAGAEAVSAALGRRRKRAGHPPGHQARQRLVSGQQ